MIWRRIVCLWKMIASSPSYHSPPIRSHSCRNSEKTLTGETLSECSAHRMTNSEHPLLTTADGPPVEVLCPSGQGPVLLVCEHAANRFPAGLRTLGLSPEARLSHAAWDPGASNLARALSARLNAPLVAARFSRLVYDCNRPPEAPGAMPTQSERFAIPGNAALNTTDRAARTAGIYHPFHRALADQLAAMSRPALVTIHSFTPVFHGQRRDTELGLLFTDRDDRLARAMLSCPGLPPNTAPNAPYGPGDGVFHTLEKHALPHGLLNVMIEVRNDLLTTPETVSHMADTLERMLTFGLSRFGRLQAQSS